MSKKKNTDRELKSPPGKRVLWYLETTNSNQKFVAKGQTAYEAAAHCGLKLSDCKDNITWIDLREHPPECNCTDCNR